MRHGDIQVSMGENNNNNNATSVQDSKRRCFCLFTLWFFVAELVMFCIVLSDTCPKRNMFGFCSLTSTYLFWPYPAQTLMILTLKWLERLGGLEWNKVVHQHQGWRLITSIWLHGGFFHMEASLFSLALVGKPLEKQFGSVRFGIIYLLSGLGGTILTSLFIQQSVFVGASGALFGVIGAQISLLGTSWPNYPDEVCAKNTLLVILVINVAVGFQPHVGNFTHVGGFITGFLLGFVLLSLPQPRRFVILPFSQSELVESQNPLDDVRVNYRYKGYQNVQRLVALILLVAWFIVGLVLVFRGVNAYKHCHWCHYLGCVSNRLWKCDQ